MSEIVKFWTGTYSKYQALAKDDGTLHYTTDTQQIFKGEVEYTKSAQIVNGLPAASAGIFGVIYIDATVPMCYTFNGTAFIPMVKGYATAIDSSADDSTAPTTLAVKNYIDNAIEDIPKTDTTGLVKNAAYDPSTRTIVLPMTGPGGTDATLTIDLGADVFVQSGLYDDTTQTLELVLSNGDEVSIPVSSLITQYNFNGSDAINVTITPSSGSDPINVTIDANISEQADNIIQALPDGLYASGPVWNTVT